MLVERGLVTEDELEAGLRAQRIYGGRLGTNLIELGHVDPNGLAETLARELHVPVAHESELESIPPDVLKIVPGPFAVTHEFLPFRYERSCLHIAVADPQNLAAVDEIEFNLGKRVKAYVAPEMLIHHFIERHYGIPYTRNYIRIIDNPSGSIAPASIDAMDHLIERGHSPTDLDAPLLHLPSIPAADPKKISTAIDALLRADTTTDAVDVVTHFAGQWFRKACLIGPTDRGFDVRSVFGPAGFAESMARARIPATTDLQGVMAGRRYFIGPTSNDAASHALLSTFGEMPGSHIAAFPLVRGQRPVALLVGIGPNLPLVAGDVQLFETLMQKCALGLQMISLKKNLRDIPDVLR